MKLSNNFRFLKIKKGSYIVFDNFAVDIKLVSTLVFNFLLKEDFGKIPISLLDILIEKKIIFLSEFDEKVFLDDKIDYINNQMESVNSLYISFTQRCNLNCNHCHFPKRVPLFENIDEFKIKKMIDSWVSFVFETNPNFKDELWVIPYGGDPLMRKDLLFLLLDYLELMKSKSDLYKNIKVYIPTNADLMMMNDLFELKRYNFIHIAFGLDGDESVHCYSKNVSKEQFDSLCKKILLCHDLGIDLSISTIGSIELFEKFDNFLILLKNLKIKKIAINFVRNTKVQVKRYIKALTSVYENHYDVLANLEFQFGKRISILKTKLPFRIDCPCYGKQFTLFPNSTVGVCPFEKEGIVGLDTFLNMNYFEKVEIKNTNKINYHELSIKNGFLYGGGCYWSHCQSCGNKTFDELINKTLFLIIFKKLYHEEL